MLRFALTCLTSDRDNGGTQKKAGLDVCLFVEHLWTGAAFEGRCKAVIIWPGLEFLGYIGTVWVMSRLICMCKLC